MVEGKALSAKDAQGVIHDALLKTFGKVYTSDTKLMFDIMTAEGIVFVKRAD